MVAAVAASLYVVRRDEQGIGRQRDWGEQRAFQRQRFGPLFCLSAPVAGRARDSGKTLFESLIDFVANPFPSTPGANRSDDVDDVAVAWGDLHR